MKRFMSNRKASVGTWCAATIAAAGIGLGGVTAQATTLAQDGFEGYTNGSTVGGQNGGTGWGGAWVNGAGGDNARMLTVGQQGGWAGGINWTGPDMGPDTGTGHMALRGSPNTLVSRQLSAPITGQDVYLGYISNAAWVDNGFVGLTNDPKAKVPEPSGFNPADWNGHMGAEIKMNGFDANAFGGTGGAATQKIYAHNFFSFSRNDLNSGSSGAADYPGSRESFGVMNINNPNQIVVRIGWDAGLGAYRNIDVWINPADLDNLGTPDSTRDSIAQKYDPDTDTFTTINPTSFSYAVLWAEHSNDSSALLVDNVMVGLSASSVVIPEPGSLALLGAGALMIVARRRKARA